MLPDCQYGSVGRSRRGIRRCARRDRPRSRRRAVFDTGSRGQIVGDFVDPQGTGRTAGYRDPPEQ